MVETFASAYHSRSYNYFILIELACSFSNFLKALSEALHFTSNDYCATNSYMYCHWLRAVVRQMPDLLRLQRLRLAIYAGFESSQMCILGGDSQDQCGDFRLPLQAGPFLQDITAMINPPNGA